MLPFTVNAIAQAAALASLAAEGELLDRVDAVVKERDRVRGELLAQGWTVPPTEANFVWLPLGEDTAGFTAACERQRDRGPAVRHRRRPDLGGRRGGQRRAAGGRPRVPAPPLTDFQIFNESAGPDRRQAADPARAGLAYAGPVKVYVIHENPDWYPPLAAAFGAAGVPHEQWLAGDGVLDLGAVPPDGVFWSRMSASAHTRGHPHAKDLTRGLLCWLESHGRRVVNGRRVLELEMSKVDQLTALRAAGFDVPQTVAVAGPGRAARRGQEAAGPVHQQGQPGRQGPRRPAVRQPRRVRRVPVLARLPGTGRRRHPAAGVPARRPAVDNPGRVRGGRVYLRASRPTPPAAVFSCARPRPARSASARRRPVRAAGRLRPPGHRAVPGFRQGPGHRDSRVRVHRDARRPAGHLRREHHHQLQRRHRGRRAPPGAACRGRFPRRPAGQRDRKEGRPDAVRILDADFRRLAAQCPRTRACPSAGRTSGTWRSRASSTASS